MSVILFLDDEQIRHDLADKYLGKEHTILHAYTAPQALDMINASAQKIDLGMLDHDLHHFVEDDGHKSERHGVWFVSNLLHDVHPDKWFARVIIHSYNADGARYMREALRKAGIQADYIPFSGSMLRQIAEELKR
jgi:CheY-like chemotaxis protein